MLSLSLGLPASFVLLHSIHKSSPMAAWDIEVYIIYTLQNLASSWSSGYFLPNLWWVRWIWILILSHNLWSVNHLNHSLFFLCVFLQKHSVVHSGMLLCRIRIEPIHSFQSCDWHSVELAAQACQFSKFEKYLDRKTKICGKMAFLVLAAIHTWLQHHLLYCRKHCFALQLDIPIGWDGCVYRIDHLLKATVLVSNTFFWPSLIYRDSYKVAICREIFVCTCLFKCL